MKLNKKGFTLIELLAVIVILGVLLAIAVPSVSKYISTARKSTYISNIKSYAEVVQDESTIYTYDFPLSANNATVIYFSSIADSMEKGGKTSPYGSAFDLDRSYVVVVNVQTAENPKYRYFVHAIDADGYGIGTASGSTNTAAAIEYDSLSSDNVLQLGAPTGKATQYDAASKNNKISLTYNNATLSATITKVYK
jgi:prepilin-type N-terminal cleavage/methylation domain-containing protein